MNPTITPELLAASPVGSTIRGAADVLAVKDGDGDDGSPLSRPWLVLGDDVWRDNAEMAAFAIADRGAANVRLVWPADTTAAQRMGAHLDEAVPVDANERPGFTIPDGQRERVASELLSLVESIHRSGQTVQAYGVRISPPDRTEQARTAAVCAERDAIAQDRDELVTVQGRILDHPALGRRVHDLTPEGSPLMVGILARLDELAALEGALTEPTPAPVKSAGRNPDAPPTVRDVCDMDERGQVEHVQALTLTEATSLGKAVRRELDDYRSAVRVRGELLTRIADLLHGAAEAIDA